MRELPCFEGILDLKSQLKICSAPWWLLRVRGCLDEESFAIANFNSKVLPIIGLDALGGKELFKVSLELRLRDGLNLI